jgi:hypothetical protein
MSTPTPTGYKFLDGTIKDFADVFAITYPVPGITTGYKSVAYGNKDLGEIFSAGTTSITTRYSSTLLGSVDLGSIFAINLKNWYALTTSGCNDYVETIAINNIIGNVYAGGIFTAAGGNLANYIAKWDGANWSALIDATTSINGCNSSVETIAIDSANNVYAGGYFTAAGGNLANYIAKWDGANWSALIDATTGINGLNGSLSAVAIDSANNVYAGGNFTAAGGNPANKIAKWDGANWSALTSGCNASVWSIAIDSANNVYVGGNFTAAGGNPANKIAKWDGANWSALTSGCNSDVRAIAIDSANNVYVGGNFTAAGGNSANYIAKWDGANWSALTSGCNSNVWSIAIDSANNVYAGGYFTAAGGNSANYIAKWDGANWSALIDATTSINGLNGTLGAVAIDSANNVYAGGGFPTAGGNPANNIAIYGEFGSVPIFSSPTNVCYKTVTISWSNIGTPLSYILTQTGIPAATYNIPGSTLSQVVTNLINGSNYTFTVTAAYANGSQGISLPLTQIMPATSTYFPGSGGVQSGSDYIITFTSPGTNTLTYSCLGVIVNCNLLLVGGGGGGAGGNITTGYSGGGGGGGNIYNNASSFSTSGTVIVGNGGNKGIANGSGSLGGTSSFLSYIANGGNGGFSSDGLGGTGNGNGGNGINTSGTGNIGGTSSLIPYSGGGGSGGGVTVTNKGGGGAGTSGIGGYAGSSLISGSNGQSASTYGSGGGGGCGFFYFGSGGDGYQGVVIFTIPN